MNITDITEGNRHGRAYILQVQFVCGLLRNTAKVPAVAKTEDGHISQEVESKAGHAAIQTVRGEDVQPLWGVDGEPGETMPKVFVMELFCIRCNTAFDAGKARAYCDACVDWFRMGRDVVHMRQNPAPGVHACGKFADPVKDCPASVYDAIAEKQVCGMCGGDDLSQGYGLGSGYGIGSYTFCEDCMTFLDFHEDKE